MKSIITAVVLALLVPSWAFSAGFHIREQGTKAMGMANAFVAQADDPSAVFYNPAGIAFQSGTQVSLGVTVINVPETEFKGTTELGEGPYGAEELNVDTTARDDIFFPPNFYATYSKEDSPWAFGIGVGSLYPLAKRWDTTSPFRDEVKEIAIKPINVNPTVAYRFDALNLAVGAGIDYTYTEVWLEKDTYLYLGGDTASHLASTEIEGDGDGWGYNFGLLWKPVESVSVAVAYRSEVELDIEGDADFYVTPTGQAVIGSLTGKAVPGTASADASTEITLPDTWSFAVAWKPVERLTVEFDVDRFGWSSYDELDIDLGSTSPLGDSPAAPKDWNDVWAYRFGVQYAVTDQLDLRAGYARDNTPAPNATVGPELPDADRDNYTVGFGYHTERAVFDVAYMWVDFDDRDVDNDIQSGTYKSEAHLFAANLTYFF
ncbi:MAG: TonB-dependent receptor [Desulfuromonas sp.]|nr:TonB-dependent receptor [Desulfuromonas sp.]